MNSINDFSLMNRVIGDCATIQGMNRSETLRLLLSCLDLTTLEATDNDEKVIALCHQATSYTAQGLPNVAAVCVYPNFTALVRTKLEGSGVKTACVAGAFPSGQSPLHIRIEEVKYALEQGAQEIDMVISRGRFLEGDYSFVHDEVEQIKKVCRYVHLKVILETGELATPEKIYKASEIAMNAGADFIKTSTGKAQPTATPEAVWVMLQAIRSHFEKTGHMVGIKPSGGIVEPNQAILYARLVKEVLG
ncbi:MAG TPA: deoxyribose-phosphate aldolase, partial [Bacteroidales bacterium]|nr:deoxyribose-phosphate aldolase [Bacteroidales bacterium]